MGLFVRKTSPFEQAIPYLPGRAQVCIDSSESCILLRGSGRRTGSVHRILLSAWRPASGVRYAATLGAKIALALLLSVPGRQIIRFHKVVLVVFALLMTASCVFHDTPLEVWLAGFGFLSHLLLTLACVKANQARAYVAAMAYAGFVMAVPYDPGDVR